MLICRDVTGSNRVTYASGQQDPQGWRILHCKAGVKAWQLKAMKAGGRQTCSTRLTHRRAISGSAGRFVYPVRSWHRAEPEASIHLHASNWHYASLGPFLLHLTMHQGTRGDTSTVTPIKQDATQLHPCQGVLNLLGHLHSAQVKRSVGNSDHTFLNRKLISRAVLYPKFL